MKRANKLMLVTACALFAGAFVAGGCRIETGPWHRDGYATLRWTIDGQTGAAACDRRGADRVEIRVLDAWDDARASASPRCGVSMATALLDEGWYHAELTLLDPEGGAISSALRSDGFYVVHDRSIVVAAVDFAGCPPILPVAVGLCDGGGIVELRDATGCVVEYACAADVAPTTRR